MTIPCSCRGLLGAAVVTALMGGCSTSPPGAGFTSGGEAKITADDKPATRDDLQMPKDQDSGDAALADSAATLPAETASGGNPRGQGASPSGAAEAKTSTGEPEKSGAKGEAPEVRATPPKVEPPADPGAQGATRPSGDVKVGTPRGPQ